MTKEDIPKTYALLSQFRNSVITNSDDLILAMDKIVESILPKWISVEDELPEEHTDVLVYYHFHSDNFDNCHYQTQDSYYRGRWEIEDDKLKTVTHWMPLPNIPK